MVHPDIWYTQTFGTPRHLVHPDIWYTLPCRCVTERVYQMSWTFGTPFPYRFLTERVYQMSMTFGTPFPYWQKGVRNVWVYQMVLDHLSGCTKCQGVPNVCGLIVWVPNVRVYQMSGCTKCHWCTKCHVIVKTHLKLFLAA